MDISHITKLLSSLGKNQVTIPIVTNEYNETNVHSLYGSTLKDDIFNHCDDFMKEIQKHKGVNSNNQVIKKNKISYSDKIEKKTTNSIVQKDNSVYFNLIHVFACVQNNMLIFETKNEKILTAINSYLRELQNYVSNNTDFKSVMIDDKKITKVTLLQELTKILNFNDLSLHLHIDNETNKLLILLNSKYLTKHIVLYDNKGEIIYYQFDYTNDNIEDVLCITKGDNGIYYLEEILKVQVFKEKFIKNNITAIKQEENYKENLKSLSVKDLRQIAKKLCIDIVDTHTSKLYSKTELRLLIEAQLNSI
jgi:hypothetical protein